MQIIWSSWWIPRAFRLQAPWISQICPAGVICAFLQSFALFQPWSKFVMEKNKKPQIWFFISLSANAGNVISVENQWNLSSRDNCFSCVFTSFLLSLIEELWSEINVYLNQTISGFGQKTRYSLESSSLVPASSTKILQQNQHVFNKGLATNPQCITGCMIYSI